MIGRVYYVRFCCDNPIGEHWHHNCFPVFQRIHKAYIPEKDFTLEVHRGVLRPYEYDTGRPVIGKCKARIWQVDN